MIYQNFPSTLGRLKVTPPVYSPPRFSLSLIRCLPPFGFLPLLYSWAPYLLMDVATYASPVPTLGNNFVLKACGSPIPLIGNEILAQSLRNYDLFVCVLNEGPPSLYPRSIGAYPRPAPRSFLSSSCARTVSFLRASGLRSSSCMVTLA